MGRQYPRFGGILKRPNPKAGPKDGKPCVVCGKMTTGKCEIQVSWFRGDDEIAYACSDHISDANAVLAGYLNPKPQEGD